MSPYRLFAAALAGAAAAFVAHGAGAQEFSARLSGFNEIPAILTDATATLRLALDRTSNTLDYKLSYSSGFTSTVTQAHIHFGKIHVAGGIVVFLCTNLGNGPPGTPACPPAPATVSGTLTSASIVGPTAQNVPIGVFDGIEDALISNTAYANIHTVNFPAGEIRGQVLPGRDQGQNGQQD